MFLVTTEDINAGDELVFWAHDPTLAWSRKKMEKTSKFQSKKTGNFSSERKYRKKKLCNNCNN